MKWIVLLRAVNVGGTSALPMADLRTALADAGARDVASYIQSGNLVMTTTHRDPRRVEAWVGQLVADRFGFRPGVMAFDAETLGAALAEAPWDEEADPRHAHLAFFTGTPHPDAPERLEPYCTSGEEIRMGRSCLYVHFPDGAGRSRLSGRIEAGLGCAATARNLNTVRAIAAMI